MSIAIIGVLLSLLLPAARSTLASARGFKCQMAQRSIAFDFAVFADDNVHGSRGNDDSNHGMFHLETFVESEYQIDEFWAWGSDDSATIPDAAGNDPMRCPEVRGELTLRRNTPCSAGAINPPQNISFGFNVRLYMLDGLDSRGRTRFAILTSRILDQAKANVPLLWDVDGEVAIDHGQLPIFSGPSLDSAIVFADDRYWFPALRHNRKGNFAFVDGHVADSRDPLAETTWQWGYQPAR